ncbi:3132_t:CDS:2, partial [Funneliformis geosporum]
NMNEKTSITLFGLTGHGKSSIANMLIKVYDTVGVGEPSTGTVPYKEAVKKIRNYFSKCETSLNYIAFVKKKGRFTEEDRKMFNLFKEIFEGSENNFIIIITHSDPPEDDDVIIHQRKRSQSLRRMTDALSFLNRKEIKLQVLSSFQMAENKVAKVVYFVPVAGSAYQLISSGYYYKMGKSNLAKERLKKGVYGAILHLA